MIVDFAALPCLALPCSGHLCFGGGGLAHLGSRLQPRFSTWKKCEWFEGTIHVFKK